MSTLRAQITDDMKLAMKNKDTTRLATLRMVNAALKDKDIEIRVAGEGEVSDADVLTILQKMLKQREESASTYRENNRPELAEKEEAEIVIINDYMPKQLEGTELDAAIDEAVKKAGAEGPRDMGKVMAYLKEHYAGQINMGSVSGIVKTKLN